MIKVTAQQRANAIEARDVMWPSVPPENVANHLNFFRDAGRVDCETHACFGGWCAVWPSFNRQGVHPNFGGAPITNRLIAPYRVSVFLFGKNDLFDERGPDETGTDHEVVTKRLNDLIANSEVIE